jgi:ABC-type branched-subunit amino acid transport system ATPase component/ABC-type branched-subunit amino acid transport system permease subunit
VLWAVFTALLILPLVSASNLYLLRLAGTAGLYITLALGLNVVTGFAGVLDMGYVAFYGIGAYSYALLASYHLGLHLPFWVALPAAALAGAASSLLVGIPTLRLRGDYLAIVTLAFGQIFRLLVINLDRPVNLTNGPNGIVGVDPPLGLGVSFAGLAPRLYLIAGLALLTYFVTLRLDRSKYGRAWIAMKQDYKAAGCLGIDSNRYRLLAFAYGATVASLAGALFSMWQGAVFPQNFTTQELVTVFCMVVLGGIGNVVGSVLGAVVLVVLPELLRGYAIYRMLLYGLTLVLVMRFRPQGFLPRRLRVPRGVASVQGYEVPQVCGGTLKAERLSLSFAGLAALTDVSFEVRRGEVLGIIGPNGAGKTTLFNVISGIYQPSSGHVTLDGKIISGLPAHRVCELGVARTFQNIRLFSEMTIEENILVGHHRRLQKGFLSTVLNLPGWRKMEAAARSHVGEVLAFLGYGMAEKRHASVTSLNYADRRRVELGRAIIANPKILLLDEPAAGMTSEEIEELIVQIRELNAAGYTIALIEHHLPVIMQTCHRVMVLDHGQELALGTPEEVVRDQAVIDAYLGTGAEEPEPRVLRSWRSVPPRPLLELEGVSAAYGPVAALHEVDLTVNEGELVCLLGSNAAGKTTTLKAILGALPLTAGRVTFAGRRIDGLPTSEIIRAGIAVVPEGRRVFTRLTVRENLELGAYLERRNLAQNLRRVYELFPVLEAREHQKAGTLSGGEQQMLAIGRALMTAPKLICMDEPSMGLAPILVQTVMHAIEEINASGTAILLVEQNAAAAVAIADRSYLLHLGRTSAGEGDARELAENIRQAYLS